MTKYDHLLQTVRACDYRVVDESGCGCKAGQIRCLLGRGKWDKDRYEVTMHDCLECTKGGEDGNQRPVDEVAEVAARNDGVADHPESAPSSDRRDGAASKFNLVLTNEGPLEREILRLEREMQQLWFEVHLAMNFKSTKGEQGLSGLINTINTGVGSGRIGGGIGVGGGKPPTGYGCDGGMALNIPYWDPVIGLFDLVYDPFSGTFKSGPQLTSTAGGCGCTAQDNVPVEVVWSPASVDLNWKTDGSGCPTPGSLTDPLNGHSSWGGVPTISDCGASDPNTFTSDSSGMTNPNNSGTDPSCGLGYSPFLGQFPDFGNAVNTGGADCPYVPRHLVWRESQHGLKATLNYTGGGVWQGSCSVDYPGNAFCDPVPGMTLIIKKFAVADGNSAGVITYLAINLTPPRCPNPSSPITRTAEEWDYHRNCSTPYSAHGTIVNPGNSLNALWTDNGVLSGATYTLAGR